MSIEIKDDSTIPTLDANLVPAHIQYSGPANTESYFTPSKSKDEKGNTAAYFRGLRLIGEPIALPKESSTFLVNKHESVVAAPETPEGYKTVFNYIPAAKIESVTGYGHDSLLAQNSQYRSLSEWEDISNIIHS